MKRFKKIKKKLRAKNILKDVDDRRQCLLFGDNMDFFEILKLYLGFQGIEPK